MPSRTSLVALMVAACSGGAGAPKLITTHDSPETITVPLIATSSEVTASQIAREDMSPPWSLTASDGSGLLLSRVDAKAVFEGPLAFTELHLYFYNHEDRVREGTFQITLPQNAAVSRFAMETNGQWMEAEVVEKQLARRAYDDFLHRRQDPALLEKAAGNQFTAKVFPIAGKSLKHIVISYSQELPGAHYTLPLKGLPKTERVDVSLAVMDPAGKRVEEKLSERNWTPDRDFHSTVALGNALAATTATGATLVAAQIEVGTDTALSHQAPTGVTIMVDTSASRALGFAAYVRSIRQLVDSLRTTYGATLPVQVIAYDQDAQQIFSGKAYEYGDAHTQKLLERGAAGASDLGQALAWTAQQSPLARVLVVTDGVITAGSEGADLAKQVSKLANVKVERIDFALAGGLRDDKAMAALVRSGLQRAGTVLDLDKDPIATAIAENVALDVVVDIPGAEWVYPKVIPAARAGQKTTVYAKLAKATQTLDVKVSGKTQRIGVVGGTQPLVERAVAAAEIAEMEEALAKSTGKDAAQLRAAIAKKSVAARVISSQTSLLVLESDADFATYGINRKSLADILVVGANGIERKNRTNVVRPQVQIASSDASKDDVVADKKPEPMKEQAAAANVAMDEGPRMKRMADDGVFGGVAGGSVGGDITPGPGAPPAPVPMEAPARRPPPREEAEAERQDMETAVAQHRQAAERAERRQSVRISDEDLDSPLGASGGGYGQAASRPSWPPPDAPPALTGELAQITRLIRAKKLDAAVDKARDWHAREPGNVLALVALGDALEAKGAVPTAARVYGSIIDLFPGRADMRRFAGERLSRLTAHAKDLIVDTYKRAVADRPDHMTGHRLLAYALVRAGKHAEAFQAILAGIDSKYRDDSYAGGERVLREDASMIGAAYAAADPSKRTEIAAQLEKRGLAIATRASTRFILYWETDANDVDFHIQDARGGHAFYSSKQLPSGGELYADITTGYGPECFAIPGTPKAGPYHLSIDYYSQGPMGFGMGLLQVQRFDGKGGLSFEDRPYVIMNDHAYADLGYIK